ncbi:hypothetical protein G4B88_011497 [Cannabis sativa]|uniref:RmlD-like substrate binding domain-containing protein n=1 Tax=Cannabis sativa TaxID=3483 RepID=A0A7J6H9B9_CANSA|nr:hypothetical protein G4B88_011497 [Cannabis sativa]
MLVPPTKSTNSPRKPPLKFLIYGRTGWIGGLLGKLCEKQGIPFEYGKGRLEDRASLLADLQHVKPTHVFNAAGVTGRPNVDWCESHKPEVIRANVAGTLTIADVCREQGLLLMNYATECIFEYDAAHPEEELAFRTRSNVEKGHSVTGYGSITVKVPDNFLRLGLAGWDCIN